ncbi:MAG: hypothetical protein COB04_19575 [Gammaproteobacteria bacterium]|nr:MAG: hypothetical protein COB04_19575 [Gammaproteobacteria bacterium]
MGSKINIDYDKFPLQSSEVGQEVNVCFHRDIEHCIDGVIVRADREKPFVTIIRLSDGRHVLDTECQYQDK